MQTAIFIARAVGNVALVILCIGAFWAVLVVTP